MRGFPLLSVSFVIAFFALAWWPLQQLTSQSTAAPASETTVTAAGDAFTVRAVSSHPLERFSLEHLGQSLLAIDGADASLEIEHAIESLDMPSEGVEFWVEAILTVPPGENQRPAIRIELIPEDPEMEPMVVTLWGQSGESSIENAAFFKAP